MIRTVLAVLFVFCFLILSIPAFLVELIIGLFSMSARDISSLRIVQGAFRIVSFISGEKITVIGRDRIPRDKAVLYISNHRSIFDIITAYALCPCPTGFMAKKEIKKIPLLSTWMVFLHCLFIDRGNPRSGIRVIQECVKNIENGISVFIYPEGTRSKGEDETMLPFKLGSFKAAQKTGCPIVLVSMSNTRAIFERQAPWIKSEPVVIEFSEPILPSEIDEKDYKHIGMVCQEKLQAMVDKNRELIPS